MDKLATQCNFNNESNNQSEKGRALSVFYYLSFRLAMFEIYLMSSAHLPSCLPTFHLVLQAFGEGTYSESFFIPLASSQIMT